MKKSRIIIISIIIINIACFIILAILDNQKKEDIESTLGIELKKTDLTIEDIYSKLDIKIDNLYELVKLESGEVETAKFTTVIADFVKEDFISTYNETKNLNESGLNNYYNRKQEEIKSTYGIEEKETFIDLANKLKVLENTPNYESVNIVKNSCKIEGNYIFARMQVNYENNSNIEFNVKFANKSDLNTAYVIICE